MRAARVRCRIKGTKIYADAFTLFGGADGSQPYDAAGSGRRALTWRASSAGPNAALTYALPNLRARSRDAVRKVPFAESGVAALETNIVGTGIKPQFRTSDAGFNAVLGELFLAWTDEADADGLLDWYGLQALTIRSIVEAGEVFARFRVRRAGDMATVPLQIQLLEAEFCPADRFESRAGRDVRNGIEFDLVGRRTAYFMYRRHPHDWTSWSGAGGGDAMPVPASEVAHVYSVRRPGLIRGEPWLGRALIKLHELDLYDDATLKAKQVAALFAGFIESPDTLTEDEAVAGRGPLGETRPDESGTSLAALEPGLMQRLQRGEKISFNDPPSAGADYEPYSRDQARKIAVAIGALYEQVTGDYSQGNDRTWRASVSEFRRRVGMIQHSMLVHMLCRPAMNRWIDLGELSGAIRLPRGIDAAAVKRSVRWVPQGWSYIHPVQDVEASEKAVRAGFKSRSQAVSEQGDNSEEIDRETAADNARADGLGVAYDSDGRRPGAGKKATAAADNNPEDSRNA